MEVAVAAAEAEAAEAGGSAVATVVLAAPSPSRCPPGRADHVRLGSFCADADDRSSALALAGLALPVAPPKAAAAAA